MNLFLSILQSHSMFYVHTWISMTKTPYASIIKNIFYISSEINVWHIPQFMLQTQSLISFRTLSRFVFMWRWWWKFILSFCTCNVTSTSKKKWMNESNEWSHNGSRKTKFSFSIIKLCRCLKWENEKTAASSLLRCHFCTFEALTRFEIEAK